MTRATYPGISDERLDRLVRQLLADRAEDVAVAAVSADAMAELVTTRLRPSPVGRGWLLLAAALLAVLLIGGALAVGGVLRIPSPPSVQSVPQEWTGPLRPNSDAMPVIPREGTLIGWNDGRDTSAEWIDIESVRAEGIVPLRWTLALAGFPPPASASDSTQQVSEYGVVLDATGDGLADFEIGISTDTPEGAGDYRVWMTNLATGNTHENDGPSYGFPVDFSHPDERPPDGSLGGPSMTFFFIPGSAPTELYAGYVNGTLRFYTWASVTEAGRVTASDYAPDAGWLETAVEAQP